MIPARRLAAYAFLCLGGATAANAGGRYAVGEWQRQAARRAWNESRARALVAMAHREAVRGDVRPASVASGAPVARLVIPRLAIDEIVLEGVDAAALNAGPGHLPGSAFPGERGNAVLSAHRDRHFARLGAVQTGDTIVTESGALESRWVVTSKRVIDAKAPALFSTREATLTLTTCWPIRFFGTAPERLVVTAKLIAPAKPASFAEAGTT